MIKYLKSNRTIILSIGKRAVIFKIQNDNGKRKLKTRFVKNTNALLSI